MQRSYRTTSSSVWFAVLALPFSGLILFVGIAIFAGGALYGYSMPVFVFGALATLIGLGATYSAINYSRSVTTIDELGIHKKTLLSRKRLILWPDILAWRHVAASEAEIERLEVVCADGAILPIYSNEVESDGLDCVASELRDRIGAIETST